MIEIHPVPGLPEVVAGDDLAALLGTALQESGIGLRTGDLVVVSSKVVAKAEGRLLAGDDREAAIEQATTRVVAERLTPRGTARIVETAGGLVLAAAGVDASNVPAGTVLLLPEDADASAVRLRSGLAAAFGGVRVGVVVSDTLGRPWRIGQVDTAIGAAGVRVGEDLAGVPDAGGRPLEVTHRALADELAAAADLVKGKVDGVPVALVRGLSALVLDADDPGPGARALQRPAVEDWFRLGHAEAVRAALGVPPGSSSVAVQPVARGSVTQRLRRAVDVALASPAWPAEATPKVTSVVVDEAELDDQLAASGRAPDEGARARPGESAMALVMLLDDTGAPHGADSPADPHDIAALAALVQRVLVAAWAEDLDAAYVPRPHVPPTALAVRAVDRS